LLLRAAEQSWWPKIHCAWPFALLLFVAADIVAFCATLGNGSPPAKTVPTSLDNGRCSPRKLLRDVVARLLGRK
jgi:hypothetical protein